MNATGTDPGSLSSLHDIILPAPVSIWPPAPGWYFVMGLAAVLACWAGCKAWRRWRANAYRRAALAEWNATVAAGKRPQRVENIIKRAALHAWPRGEVAALTGEDWRQFLVTTGGDGFRDDETWALFESLCYDASVEGIDPSALQSVADAGRTWLAVHRGGVR